MSDLDSQIAAERRLDLDLQAFPGEWVAVTGFRIVAHKPSAEELYQATESMSVERRFRVPDNTRE